MISCSPRVAIAAGGTGGHLFPALALGKELSRRGYVPVLLTDERGMGFLRDGAIQQDLNEYRIVLVAAATFAGKRGPRQYLSTGSSIVKGIITSWRLLGRKPVCASIGFGGYPSFAPLLAARLRGVPVCLHEQNAVFGRANRFLSPFASAIAFAFPVPESDRLPHRTHSVVTGTPVREEVLALRATYRAPDPDEAFRLLVFGGSQGAQVLSRTMPLALARLPAGMRIRLRITQQCRREDIADLNRSYDESGIVYESAPFFADLPRRISSAHLVLARAGASTIAELAVIGCPAILLPLPRSLDSDQARNADALVQAGGAWSLFETPDLARELAGLLAACMQKPHRLLSAGEAAKAFGKPDAALRLADLVESVIKNRPVRKMENRSKHATSPSDNDALNPSVRQVWQ